MYEEGVKIIYDLPPVAKKIKKKKAKIISNCKKKKKKTKKKKQTLIRYCKPLAYYLL